MTKSNISKTFNCTEDSKWQEYGVLQRQGDTVYILARTQGQPDGVVPNIEINGQIYSPENLYTMLDTDAIYFVTGYPKRGI